jgi:hypothetical protein
MIEGDVADESALTGVLPVVKQIGDAVSGETPISTEDNRSLPTRRWGSAPAFLG